MNIPRRAAVLLATILALVALTGMRTVVHATEPTSAPTFTMTYGPGTCDVHPDAPVCTNPPPTPYPHHWPHPWVNPHPTPAPPTAAATPHPWTPEPDGHVTSYPAPLIYTSTDGYSWVLRPGKPA